MATVQEMIKQVEQENLGQTAARSAADPFSQTTYNSMLQPSTPDKGITQTQQAAADAYKQSKIVTGGTVGATPTGQGISSVPIVNQAITTTNSPASTSTPIRYDTNGNVIPTKPNSSGSFVDPLTGNTMYRTATGGYSSSNPNQAQSPTTPGIMSQEEYQKKYGAQPVNEAAIRESVRQQLQAQIDAVNGAYDAMVREQNRINEANAGSTRAINARSGLIGSDFGAANDQSQRSAGQKAIDAINAERAMKTAAINDAGDARALSMIEAEKKRKQDEANQYSTYLADEQKKALDYTKNLGASGLTVETLKQKDPQGLAKILQATGMDEVSLDAAFKVSKLESDKLYADKTGDKDVANKVRDDARATIQLLLTQFGSEAFKNLPPEERRRYEKLAGFPTGVLDNGAQTLTERKVVSGLEKSDQYTLSPGEVRYDSKGNVIAKGPEKVTGEKVRTTVVDVGGRKTLINYDTGETIKDLGDSTSDKTRTTVVDAGGRKLLINYDTGETIKDLGAGSGTGADKPTTSDERKAATFAQRTEQADETLKKLESKFTDPTFALTKFLPNVAQSSEYQQFDQAKRNFINALLRRESGAAISDSEFSSADKQYFAQPGDSPAVLEQKRQNRLTAIGGLRNEAGRAYGELTGSTGTGSTQNYSASIKNAIDSGYSADQIVNHLQSDPNVAQKIKQAQEAGYSSDAILKYLQGSTFNQPPEHEAKNGSGVVSIKVGTRQVSVNSAIADRLARADADYFAATGKHIQINEALRSHERQAELYKRFKEGKGGRAAPPGKSYHETGKAVDVGNWEEAGPYLRKYGFKNNLADDRNHFSIGEFG